jgi:alginate O-acetyltransferase complex protein AlgI
MDTLAAVRPDARRFLLLCVQLASLLAVFWLYHIEGPVFFSLAVLSFAGFAVHYWLPLAWKERFFVLLSMAGAFIVLEPGVAALVLATGGLIFGVTRLPMSWHFRLGLILAIAVSVMLARSFPDAGIPGAYWPTLGALFMFRLVLYMYALKHATTPFGFREFASYFFMLPNFYFLFFPVVDFQTMRKGFMRRDIHSVAQQGILWIVRGTVQLLLYRVVVQLRGNGSPHEITTLPLLVENMVLTYLLYLKVSGSFHIIVGLIRLFGYDLPETHRRWLLASSLTDFWRRINIYWKDFMVTMVYLPVYFRLRRGGDLRAQLVGTALVFVITWLAHAWQYWWLSGRWLLSGPDTMFWGLLGALVMVNVYWEVTRQRRRTKDSPFATVLATAGTFSLIVFLWTLWSSPTLKAWLELLTYRSVG